MQTQTTTEYRNLSLNHRLVTQLLIAESVSGGARSLVQAHLLMPDAPESFVMQSALCHKSVVIEVHRVRWRQAVRHMRNHKPQFYGLYVISQI